MKFVGCILLAILFFGITSSYGQGVPKYLRERIADLKKSKVDTLITFSPCFGLGDYPPAYIIWVANDNLYLQKYFFKPQDGTMYVSNPLLINEHLKKFLMDNLQDMLFERILPVVVKFRYDSIEYYEPLEFRHECVDYLVFFVNENVRRKEFTYNAVYRDSITRDEKFENLNYKFNQRLYITQFVKKMKVIFKEVEKEMEFLKHE